MQSIRKISVNQHLNVYRVLTSSIHTSGVYLKADDRKNMLASVPKKDEGAEGEKTISLDSLIQKWVKIIQSGKNVT